MKKDRRFIPVEIIPLIIEGERSVEEIRKLVSGKLNLCEWYDKKLEEIDLGNPTYSERRLVENQKKLIYEITVLSGYELNYDAFLDFYCKRLNFDFEKMTRLLNAERTILFLRDKIFDLTDELKQFKNLKKDC
jgi:hypothetical protein